MLITKKPLELKNGKFECGECGLAWDYEYDAMECCGKHIKDIQIDGDHYRSKAIQPWDAMEAWMDRDQFIGFLRGNAIKYLARAGSKGPDVVDYQKAAHYLQKLVEVLENG